MNIPLLPRAAAASVVAAVAVTASGCGADDERTRACALQSELPASVDPYEAASALRPQDIEQPAIRQAAARVVTTAQAARADPANLGVTSDFADAVNALAQLCD